MKYLFLIMVITLSGCAEPMKPKEMARKIKECHDLDLGYIAVRQGILLSDPVVDINCDPTWGRKKQAVRKDERC